MISSYDGRRFSSPSVQKGQVGDENDENKSTQLPRLLPLTTPVPFELPVPSESDDLGGNENAGYLYATRRNEREHSALSVVIQLLLGKKLHTKMYFCFACLLLQQNTVKRR